MNDPTQPLNFALQKKIKKMSDESSDESDYKFDGKFNHPQIISSIIGDDVASIGSQEYSDAEDAQSMHSDDPGTLTHQSHH
jgi:hypothetical protein